MVVWLRPEYILAIVTSLYYCSHIVLSKTYDKFWCATEEGHHQISCPDETSLLTDISIRKVHRRTEMCEPDDHSDYLVNCQSLIDGSLCEGNKTCSIEISSRDYIQCGGKTYPPTYFFVKYTCTQIHTMCTDTGPIRNTLYGYIVSPAYPHPMADNLKCSISIEADPSMYIELSPVQIHLQDAYKCRAEYLEIFGYDSAFDENNFDKNHNWKAYHIWCGADRSQNNPLSHARYLISSNSLYMSLQTTVSKKSRYFKIRYKGRESGILNIYFAFLSVVPPIGRSQYNSDGIALDSLSKGHIQSVITFKSSTAVIPTTVIIPSLNNSDVKYLNGTIIKRTSKKKVIMLIGIITGVIVILIAIAVAVLVVILIKRRRSSSSSTTSKKTTPAAPSNTTSKTTAKSPDKAPLLEQADNTATAATKRKLVPERTVQAADTGTSRFKSGEAGGAKTGSTKTDSSASKPTLTAADSGIYGADISEDKPTPSKPVSPLPPPAAAESEKIYGIDFPDVVEPTLAVVVNPSTENSTISAIVPSINVETQPTPTIENEEKPIILDNTIQSAYPSLIDATTSENEGTICGSALQSRRTSNLTPTLMNQQSNSIETIVIADHTELSSYATIPFNPLHVILKKDANKYYTTEYI